MTFTNGIVWGPLALKSFGSVGRVGSVVGLSAYRFCSEPLFSRPFLDLEFGILRLVFDSSDPRRLKCGPLLLVSSVVQTVAASSSGAYGTRSRRNFTWPDCVAPVEEWVFSSRVGEFVVFNGIQIGPAIRPNLSFSISCLLIKYFPF